MVHMLRSRFFRLLGSFRNFESGPQIVMEDTETEKSSIKIDAKSLNLSRFAFQSPSKKELCSPSAGEPDVPIRRKRSAEKNSNQEGKISKQKIDKLGDVRLPDFLKNGLDILFVGFNPGCNSASQGHHYAGPGNHFWKCLHLSGLLSEPLTFKDDVRILDFNFGLTNIVSRPSVGSSDLSKAELEAGAVELRRKIVQYGPKIVVFNGLGIYETFAGRKDFLLGKQPIPLTGTDIVLYVMPSSSPRGSKWPRMQDKLKFYQGLLHLRDFLLGKVVRLDSDKVVFSK